MGDKSYVEQYICELCRNNFGLHALYACNNGHFYCTNCFKSIVDKGKSNWKIDKCKQRNANNQGDVLDKPNLMFPNINDFVIPNRTIGNVELINLYRSSSLLSLSKKPIVCPYKSCKKAIAVGQMEDHFLHEHNNVTLIKTQFDARNGLDLHVNDIRYNERICLVLINIINEDNVNVYPIAKSPSSFMVNPSIVAIITKLASYEEYLHGEDDDDNTSEYSNPCSPTDKIFIWVSSNIPNKYFYTLAVSTVCNSIRLKYYGPMLTLTEDYEKLCENGQGLILSQNHIMGMTDNGQKPLKLDVLIHEEYENEPNS